MIKKLKSDFLENKISKGEFIDSIYEFHKELTEYSSELENTEISKITIEPTGVIFEINGGNKFFCDLIDKRTPGLEAFNFNYYEKIYSDFLLEMTVYSKITFDIGANIGWYSIFMSKDLQNKIFAFEPVSKSYEILKKNIKLNKRKNIVANNFGLSNFNGSSEFFYDPKNATAASAKNILESDLDSIRCDFIQLDDYMQTNNLSSLDLIKCDVEGGELNVIKGGLKSIQEHEPIIFIEMLRKWSLKFDYHPNNIISLLKGLNYSCFTIREQGIYRIESVDGNTLDTNFVFFNNFNHNEIIGKHEFN